MVYLGDDANHSIYGCGNASIILEDGQIWEIPNDLHVPNFKKSLFLQNNLITQGVATCNVEVDLYKLGIKNKSNVNIIIALTITIVYKANLWHLHLGHINQN
jgi:hypothetical protein